MPRHHALSQKCCSSDMRSLPRHSCSSCFPCLPLPHFAPGLLPPVAVAVDTAAALKRCSSINSLLHLHPLTPFLQPTPLPCWMWLLVSLWGLCCAAMLCSILLGLQDLQLPFQLHHSHSLSLSLHEKGCREKRSVWKERQILKHT